MFLFDFAYCQKKEALSIETSKTNYASDSLYIYSISISNFSDSIICILHSHFVLLSVGNNPQALTATENNETKEWYNLKQAAKDTLFTYEVPQYRASIILPYQSLNFKILVHSSNKEQFLTINYFYLLDFCYRNS